MSAFYPKNEPKMSQGLSCGLSEDGSNRRKIPKIRKSKSCLFSYYNIILIFITICGLSYGLSEDKSEENPDITITITNTIYI